MYVILVSIPYLPGVLSVTQTEHSTYITIPILECVCINTILISLLPFNTLHNISIQENDDMQYHRTVITHQYIRSTLTDPETATYNHTLAVTGRLLGQYECRVSNRKFSDKKELGVVGM